MRVKSKRGFAAMSEERRREISAIGGAAVQKSGTGHKWTEAEARKFGALGGRSKKKREAAA